jgi:hypothetical protein
MVYKTVKLKNYGNVFVELEANAAIIPGMLVEVMSTNKLRAHASAATFAMPMFALEDGMQGKGLKDNYVAGDQVQVWIPGRGDEVYALLVDGGQAVAIGDTLVSAGGGYLKKSQDTINSWESVDAGMDISNKSIIGIALEAKDISGSGSDSSAGGQYYPYCRIRIV